MRVPARLRALLVRYAPTNWVKDATTHERLVRAGFDGDEAPLVYTGARVVLLTGLPAVSLLLGFGRPILETLIGVTLALVAAWFLPLTLLHVTVARRQERIRRAIPDAVDLLRVCVEAGSSIESAIQRVGRDMVAVHPELAGELAMVVRRTSAGMSRADALRGLYTRTHVDELRTIAARIVQSERWGASVATALRESAETLRAKRRRAAERRASAAPIKMTVAVLLLSAIGYFSYQLSAISHR